MALNFVTGDVQVNGVKIHYYRAGGDKPPVVLAHGITDNGRCWDRLTEVLAQNYEVIAIDARGHGLSEPNPPEFTIESHAADLAGLVNALDLGKPVIMGHSMGASDVAFTAATYPDVASAIILEDPPWFVDYPDPDRIARLEEWRNELVERKSQTAEEIIESEREKYPNWAEEEWPVWAEAKLRVNPDVVEWLRSATPFMGWREFVPKIQCPILLITGDPKLEALVTPEIAQEVAALAGNIAVENIENAGHSIRRENFEDYVSVVGKFLRKFA